MIGHVKSALTALEPPQLRRRIGEWRERERIREVDARLGGMMLPCGPVTGKRVLDLGCDSGMTIRRLVAMGAKEGLGVNLSARSRQLSPLCRIERRDAAKTSLPPESYDLVVSFAAFEHFHNLSDGLSETRRVLRPGGLLYAHFGPIWSGPDGHHLWTQHGGRSYTYLNTTLPPWCHLLMDRPDLMEHCRRRHGATAAEAIVQYVYDCPDQNRLVYEDYLRVFDETTGLRKLTVTGKVLSRGLSGAEPGEVPALLTRLQARYPGRRDFLCEAVEVLLQTTT